jgi:hypothetical protein
MDLGAQGKQERGESDQEISPMREGVTAEVESGHTEEPDDRWRGTQAKAPQPRVLHRALELLGRGGR